MELYRIITYFESLYSAEIPTQHKTELEVVQSTLRLWDDVCHSCSSLPELKQAMNRSIELRENCIVVLERIDQGILDLLKNKSARFEVLLITDERLQQQLLGPELLHYVSHYLSLSQGRIATTSLITAIKKIASREIFGAEKYLAYGTPLHFFVLSRSEDRPWFVDRFMDYVGGLEGVIPSGASEFARMAGEVLDEFLMNAIWDANPARCDTDRNIPVLLKPNEAVKVEWGVDGHILAMGVRDPFGTFKKSILLNYQEDIFGLKRQNLISINRSGAGAGIGLHMVIRRVSGLVVNLAPGFGTEVVALFDLTRSPRFLTRGPKTLHFFSI